MKMKTLIQAKKQKLTPLTVVTTEPSMVNQNNDLN